METTKAKDNSSKEKDCGCSGKSEADFKKSIAKKAAVLCASMPDESTCRSMPNVAKGRFLSTIRDFAAECTLATNWSVEEVKSYKKALDLFEATFDYLIETVVERDNDTETRQSKCGKAKKECREACDNDEDAGYFCYFDCRLEYMACLVGSL